MRLLNRIKKIVKSERTIGQSLNYMKWKCAKESVIVNYQPIRLGIFVNYECNLKCNMCLTHSGKIPSNPYKYQGSKTMNYEMFKDIVDRYRNALMVSFIGNGEPLLCEDLFKMIDYAYYKRKMETSLCVNGTLVDEFIEEIIKSPLKVINISMNAHTSAMYEVITGQSGNIFNKMLRNLRALINEKNKFKSELEIYISVIVDINTYKNIPEIIAFYEKEGINRLNISGYMDPDIDNSSRRALTAQNPEIIEFIRSMNLSNIRMNISLPAILDNEANYLCRDFLFSMSVDGDGNIGGCERKILNTSNNGKYYEENAFNNMHFQTLRKMFLNKEGKMFKPCYNCYNNTKIIWKK